MTEEERENLVKEVEQWLLAKGISLWGQFFSTQESQIDKPAKWFVN